MPIKLQPMNRFKLVIILFSITLTTAACGVQLAPGEIQFFTGPEPVVAVTPTPWPTPTPEPTPTPMPTAPPATDYTVVPAAVPAPPLPPPITGAKNVSIIKYNDTETALVLVDGVEYTLPYATLPAPPPPPPRPPTPEPAAEPPLDWDSRLDGLGVWVNRGQPASSQPIFRLIRIEYEDEVQSNGLHHIYVEVLDENGQRILGQPVIQAWNTGQAVGHTENKPWPEYALNFPMYGAQGPDNYTIYVTGARSDVVNGLGLPAGQPVNYRLTFQRQYE